MIVEPDYHQEKPLLLLSLREGFWAGYEEVLQIRLAHRLS